MVTDFVIYNPDYKRYLAAYTKTPNGKNELTWKTQIDSAMRLNYTEALKLKAELHLEHCILRGIK